MRDDPEQRVPVPVRIRRRSVARVDELAAARGLTRSDVLREIFSLGIIAYEARHAARPAAKSR